MAASSTLAGRGETLASEPRFPPYLLAEVMINQPFAGVFDFLYVTICLLRPMDRADRTSDHCRGRDPSCLPFSYQ